MTWFAVHALVSMRRVDAVGPIHVYENVFLVEAEDAERAKELAVEMARPEAEADDAFSVGGVSAVRSLGGVRKVISVSNPDPLDLDADRPASGTEITYSEFEVDSEDDLRKLAAGESVAVRYVD
jgi:hypothetical protein